MNDDVDATHRLRAVLYPPRQRRSVSDVQRFSVNFATGRTQCAGSFFQGRSATRADGQARPMLHKFMRNGVADPARAARTIARKFAQAFSLPTSLVAVLQNRPRSPESSWNLF